MNEQLKELKRKTWIILFISWFVIGLLLGVFHVSGDLIGMILCYVAIFANILYTCYVSHNYGWNKCLIISENINFLCSNLKDPIEVTDTSDENVKIFTYYSWGPDELDLDLINKHGISFIYNDILYRTLDADEITLANENKIRIWAKYDELWTNITIKGIKG